MVVINIAFLKLTFMAVAVQDVLTDVPMPQLAALLVLFAFYVRVFNFLNIERGNFYCYICYWQYFCQFFYKPAGFRIC